MVWCSESDLEIGYGMERGDRTVERESCAEEHGVGAPGEKLEYRYI